MWQSVYRHGLRVFQCVYVCLEYIRVCLRVFEGYKCVYVCLGYIRVCLRVFEMYKCMF